MARGIAYLVGAGPGDPGLITVRGLERLRTADVVLYDRLIGPDLVREARPDAELLYCGKRPDHHAMTQDEINAALVEKVGQGLTVCRLKGGDPTVFGRGAEEALALREAGLAFEIVPGVSSSVAAGAYAGVPVTLRGIASSFAVVTGHEDPTKDEASVDWRRLATATDTLVILMGVASFGSVAQELIAGGRDPGAPVACVSRATLPDQSTLVTTLTEAERDFAEANVKAPSVLIVGEVARQREALGWFEARPLFGKTALVTRTREQASSLSRLLTDAGARVVEMPVIRIVEPESWDTFDAAIDAMASYDWLVFTSANGVERARKRLRELGLDIRALAGPRIAAIGPKTAEAAESAGLRVDLQPGRYVAEDLAAALGEDGVRGRRILLVRALEGRDVLPDRLRERGAEVTLAPVYRTLPVEDVDPDALRLLDEGAVDLLTFASSSAVSNFVGALGAERARAAAARALVACMGPITARTAEEHGFAVGVMPEEHTIEALVAALVGRHLE